MTTLINKSEKKRFKDDEEKILFLEGLVIMFDMCSEKLEARADPKSRYINYKFQILNEQGDKVYSNAFYGVEAATFNAGLYPHAAFVQDTVITAHILGVSKEQRFRRRLEEYVQKLMDKMILPAARIKIEPSMQPKDVLQEIEKDSLFFCQEYIERIDRATENVLMPRLNKLVSYDNSNLEFRCLVEYTNEPRELL